jgi:hypothetical protein
MIQRIPLDSDSKNYRGSGGNMFNMTEGHFDRSIHKWMHSTLNNIDPIANGKDVHYLA